MKKRTMNLQLLSIENVVNERLTYQFNIDPKTKFPLEDPIYSMMSMHSAWYTGDPTIIHQTYKHMIGQVGGATRASFWSKEINDGIVKLHVPVASDIAASSADMLFSEMPEVSIPEAEEELREAKEAMKAALKEQEAANAPVPPVPGEEDTTEAAGEDTEEAEAPTDGPPAPPTAPAAPMPAPAEPVEEIKLIEPNGPGTKAQKRLEEIMEEAEIANRLLEAAESCSAIGGVYLVPTWDAEIADHPILAINQADNAIPEFKWGYLTAVSFYKVVFEDSEITYRLLERHEAGFIKNGLFKGSKNELGKQVPLSERPETEGLQEEIPTGWEKLMVKYVPNMKPNRRFRGSAHGQSDFAGAEPLLDALDEVYSSWMRDIRLGRARIIVPEDFLDFEEDSEGKKSPYFDVDKAVYTAMSMDPLTSKDAGLTTVQFAIRVDEHRDTAYELLERIVTHAGYSPQTFGLKVEGQSESGTALNLRERKTYVTRGKKWKYWKNALEEVMEMMLHIDNHILKNGTPVLRPTCNLADSMNADINSLATALQALNNAQALSIDTKVRLLNPDWSEEQVIAEVDAIKEEFGIGQATDPGIPSPLGEDPIGAMDVDPIGEVPEEDEFPA
jgi:A118 family predicted phage portal protein